MNIERSFTFAFKSPGGASKLLRGSLYSILYFTVLFSFVAAGYGIRILCNALEGRDAKLPEWDNLPGLFRDGLQPILVMLIYVSPILILSIIGLYVTLPIDPLVLNGLILIGASALIPLALIRIVVIGNLMAAFDVRAICSFVKNNKGTFLTAWGVSIGIWIVCCLIIGAVFFLFALLFSPLGIQAGVIAGTVTAVIVLGPVSFLSQVIMIHLFATAYRVSTPFADDREGEVRASMVMPPSLKQKTKEP